VHVLDADAVAVGGAQGDEDVAELHLAAAEVGADVEDGVEVGLAEGEFGERERGWGGGAVAERIQVGLEVAEGAVGA
jgi:hypothetical protein